MKPRKRRSVGMRVLNSVCVVAFFSAIAYTFFVGVEAIAIGAAIVALGAVTTQAAMAGEGILEVVAGIFEALLDGIAAIFEGIFEAISGIFG